MRTTIDIDSVVLKDVKRIQREEGKTLGAVVSQLLSMALSSRRTNAPRRATFRLRSFPLGRPTVDLSDRQAVQDLLDDDERS